MEKNNYHQQGKSLCSSGANSYVESDIIKQFKKSLLRIIYFLWYNKVLHTWKLMINGKYGQWSYQDLKVIKIITNRWMGTILAHCL